MKRTKYIPINSPEFKMAYDSIYKNNPVTANIYLFMMERQNKNGEVDVPIEGTPEFELMWQELNLRFPIPDLYSLAGKL
jgi:hypothetical protein